MSSPPSSSSDSGSRAFDRLHVGLQRWIWKQGWRQLRRIQEEAVEPLLSGSQDVMLAAPTAGGKTEAAFLPIFSRLAEGDEGLLCVCLSPLKALINDQYDRLVPMGEAAGVPVTRWHGDVGRGEKERFLRECQGVLVITPESLEAMLVRRGPQAGQTLDALAYTVVDEFHAFVGTERGKQVQSLMHRLDTLNRRRIPRVALSATFGDTRLAADFLRPGRGSDVLLIEGSDGGQELRLMLRGYERKAPSLDADLDESDSELDDYADIASHLFKVLRGSDNLVFANSRQRVEFFADALRRLCDDARVPNEFLPHHGSLAKELREDAEQRLKAPGRPASVVATTTLEMGIDVGSVKSIAQIGVPPSVAALRQRLGRSGRGEKEPAILRIYMLEYELSPTSTVQDQLRAQTVQSIAMVQLMLDGRAEPPDVGVLHLSTLVQQLLALIAQHGGVQAGQAWSMLCGEGPFVLRDKQQFASLLKALGACYLLAQAGDGDLVLGVRGERIVDHYDFYAAFFSPHEFQLLHAGRTLGSVPITKPITPDCQLIFAGRRWTVLEVDGEAKAIYLEPARGGRPPQFDGGVAMVHDEVRKQMRRVYAGESLPGFADARAQQLLQQGRRRFHEMNLAHDLIVDGERTCHLFPWVGDRTLATLEILLVRGGIRVVNEGIGLRLWCDRAELVIAAKDLLSRGLPTAEELALAVPFRLIGKYDEFLTDELTAANFASARFDVEGARSTLLDVVERRPLPSRPT